MLDARIRSRHDKRGRLRLSPNDLRDHVHLAVRRDGFEPGVLEDLAVDRDRDAVAEVRLQVRVALTEGAQQLADVFGVELELALAARELRQPPR